MLMCVSPKTTRRARPVHLLAVVAGAVFAALLLTPFRDDYSETGPAAGVKHVSLLSNVLNHEVDAVVVLVALLLSCALTLFLILVISSLRYLHGRS